MSNLKATALDQIPCIAVVSGLHYQTTDALTAVSLILDSAGTANRLSEEAFQEVQQQLAQVRQLHLIISKLLSREAPCQSNRTISDRLLSGSKA